MTFSLEKKEESTDVFSPKDLSLWKKEGRGRQEITETHHIPACSAPARPQTAFVSQTLTSGQAESVLTILSHFLFIRLSSYDRDINIHVYLAIMNLVSRTSRRHV